MALHTLSPLEVQHKKERAATALTGAHHGLLPPGIDQLQVLRACLPPVAPTLRLLAAALALLQAEGRHLVLRPWAGDEVVGESDFGLAEVRASLLGAGVRNGRRTGLGLTTGDSA
eukprot:CAMPEP_0180679878 /NCGR_PEP_ID=MMETSP1037_2-20121125/69159_1 /TAXON_ID=632150 /ORGANISM="Azadinium spinosum, Strain 3D9" /LENGTH=114 /DNA_ID=CAMNT_0022709635 /DNA_START=75 /DNA_END=420 /DNA_ORIENTATION=+